MDASRTTDAIVFLTAAEQMEDGGWQLSGGVPVGLARPPIEEGDIARTAMALRSIQLYGAPGRKAEFESRIERAKAAKPRTSEDRNMQLLGLRWSGAQREVLRELVKPVLAAEHSDGGWGQNPNLPSDAYATGQTLYTLVHSGLVSVPDSAFQRGAGYLLSTQLEDGSWHVGSRALPLQPYFDSEFPHGPDQFISAAATNWATMALIAAGSRK